MIFEKNVEKDNYRIWDVKTKKHVSQTDEKLKALLTLCDFQKFLKYQKKTNLKSQ